MCVTCTTGLRTRLRTVPGLLDDLLTSLAGQDRRGGGRHPLGEAPMPRLDVSQAITALSRALVGWADQLVVLHSLDVPNPPRTTPYPELDLARYAAGFLAGHVHLIRTHPRALTAHHAISDAIKAAEQRVDGKPAQWYAGTCDCGSPIYADPGTTTTRCPDCHAALDDLRDRWDDQLHQLRQHAATAADIARLAGQLYGTQIRRETINIWHHRGHLTPLAWVRRETEPDGPRFLLGDVLDRARKAE